MFNGIDWVFKAISLIPLVVQAVHNAKPDATIEQKIGLCLFAINGAIGTAGQSVHFDLAPTAEKFVTDALTMSFNLLEKIDGDLKDAGSDLKDADQKVVDLESMTKAQLAQHAADVHELDLDPSSMSKADMIDRINQTSAS